MAKQPEKSSDEKYPRTLILSPDPELPTPTEPRHTTCLLRGKTPSVKLMSRREKIKNWRASTSLRNIKKGLPLYREKTVYIKAPKTAINRPVDHTGDT